MESFPVQWEKFPDYEITNDGLIRPYLPEGINRRDLPQLLDYVRKNPSEPYKPVEHPKMVEDFWKVERDDGSSALDFVREWGLLGRDHFLPAEQSRGGDPLWWIWVHADTVRWIRDATDALRAQQGFEHIYLPGPGTDHEPLVFGDEGGDYPINWTWNQNIPDGRPRMIRDNRDDLLNRNLRGMRRVFRTSETGDKDISFFQFRSLLTMLYWHLADAIEGRTIHQCEEEDCRRYFIKRTPKQRFCPREPETNESACSRRQRQREYRRNPKLLAHERCLERKRYRRQKVEQP